MNIASLELCKELDCGRLVGNHGARGMCPMHYKRWKRTGRPEIAYPSKVTHGMTDTTEYHIWSGMVQRCTNPSNPQYRWYGARGIKVCKRWLSFENFYADMGKRPGNLEIDRIDNEGNYEPGNVKWSTRKEQMNNMRGNKNYASRKLGIM